MRSSNVRVLFFNFKCDLKADTEYGGLVTSISNEPLIIFFSGEFSKPSPKMMLLSPAPFMNIEILATLAKR